MMAGIGLTQAGADDAAALLEIPLFPLSTVLFPGGILPLRIFEQRYLDMAAVCLREARPFGVCLIASGQEAGGVAEPHPVGTLASITDWEMTQLGILQVDTLGGQRFRVRETTVAADKLLRGKVALIPDDGPQPVPPEFARLVALLHRISDELGRGGVAEPQRFDDATWVGYRISEILPINKLAKQQLLELDDPLARLALLEKFLEQRQLFD